MHIVTRGIPEVSDIHSMSLVTPQCSFWYSPPPILDSGIIVFPRDLPATFCNWIFKLQLLALEPREKCGY